MEVERGGVTGQPQSLHVRSETGGVMAALEGPNTRRPSAAAITGWRGGVNSQRTGQQAGSILSRRTHTDGAILGDGGTKGAIFEDDGTVFGEERGVMWSRLGEAGKAFGTAALAGGAAGRRPRGPIL